MAAPTAGMAIYSQFTVTPFTTRFAGGWGYPDTPHRLFIRMEVQRRVVVNMRTTADTACYPSYTVTPPTIRSPL